jgi:6-pyruvoyl-tetrahydropterin synthase
MAKADNADDTEVSAFQPVGKPGGTYRLKVLTRPIEKQYDKNYVSPEGDNLSKPIKTPHNGEKSGIMPRNDFGHANKGITTAAREATGRAEESLRPDQEADHGPRLTTREVAQILAQYTDASLHDAEVIISAMQMDAHAVAETAEKVRKRKPRLSIKDIPEPELNDPDVIAGAHKLANAHRDTRLSVHCQRTKPITYGEHV